MASSLNAEAPSFVPSQNTISYSPNYYQNPSLMSYFPFPSPFYVMPDEMITSSYYAPPPPSSYLYYYPFDTSFDQVEVVQPFVLVPVSASLVGCTIHDHELDENQDIDNIASNGDEPADGALVINRQRVVAPRPGRSVIRPLRNQDRRRGPAVSGRPGLRDSHRNFEISNDADFGMTGKTTLMIKNIPNQFCKNILLTILREHCAEQNRKVAASGREESILSEFDFFYLPMDFSTGNNKGYAFVNFTSPAGACRLHKYLQNHSWSSEGSCKVCQVNFARIQGLSKLIARNDRIPFPRSVPDDFMPVHFEPPCNGLNESIEHLHGIRIISSD